MSCYNPDIIVIPWSGSIDINIAVGNTFEAEANSAREQEFRQFSIQYIYITSQYLNYVSSLTKLSENESLSQSIKDVIKKITNDIKTNLIVIFRDILEDYITEKISAKEKKSFNTMDVLERFDESRIYHEKDINILRKLIRKCLDVSK